VRYAEGRISKIIPDIEMIHFDIVWIEFYRAFLDCQSQFLNLELCVSNDQMGGRVQQADLAPAKRGHWP
jgi:hypothetical protein